MPSMRIYQPQVAPGVSADQPRANVLAFGGQVAAALGEVENDVLAARAARQDAERRAARDAELARAGVAEAELQGATARTAADLRESAAPDGAGHTDAVLKSFDAGAEQLVGSIADPQVAGATRVRLANQRADLEAREYVWQQAKRAEKQGTDIDVGIDTSANALNAAPSWGGLNAALTRTKAVLDGTDVPATMRDDKWRRAQNRLGQSFAEGLIERNPYEAREALHTPELGALIDADAMAKLVNRADAEIKGREVAAQQAAHAARVEAAAAQRDAKAAQREAEAQLGDRIEDVERNISLGIPTTPQQVGQAYSAALAIGRPELAARVQRAGIASLTVQGLKGATPVQVGQEIARLDAEIAKAGGAVDPTLLVARDAARQFAATQRSELGRDRLGWASREGVVALAPIDPAKPQTYAARVAAAKTVQRAYGGPLTVLTDAETDAYANAWAGSPAQRTEVLASLRGLGRDGAAAAMAQIAKKAPLLAYAGKLSLGTAGVRTAADIAEGVDTLKAIPKLAPPPEVQAAFDAALGGALSRFPGTSRATVRDAAAAIYASRGSRIGKTEFDAAEFKNSLNAALGGYRDQAGTMRGGLGTHAKAQIVLPPDVSQDEFDAEIDALDDAALARNPAAAPVDARGRPVSADAIKRMRLIDYGDGRYLVSPDGHGVLAAKGGGNFVLRIARAAPK